MTEGFSVDPEILRADVRDKYRAVATDPHGAFHFHTGRLTTTWSPVSCRSPTVTVLVVGSMSVTSPMTTSIPRRSSRRRGRVIRSGRRSPVITHR